MVTKMLFAVVFVGLFLWVFRKMSRLEIRSRLATEKQFTLMAQQLNTVCTKSEYALQNNQWYPPGIKANGLFIYITETHHGDTWTPYTTVELELSKKYVPDKFQVKKILNNKLKSANIRLYRGTLQTKRNRILFKMPMLLYNEKLRKKFVQIINLLQKELTQQALQNY